MEPPLVSGTIVELLQDWIGSPVEPPMENRTTLSAGTMLRVFTRVGDAVEVFILGQAAVYRIPARLLRRCGGT